MTLDQYIITEYGVLAAFLVFSYIVGSVSFGIVAAKLFKIGNLRKLGSGNIGTTNVLRTGNKKAAALTLISDSGKGYIPFIVATSFINPNFIILVGLATFIGHLFPIFHNFRGGKGVATFIGIMFGINMLVGIVVCFIWICIALASKKSSLSALGASFVSPFLVFSIEGTQHILLTSILVLLVWFRHKHNIKRILSRTEPSISFRK